MSRARLLLAGLGLCLLATLALACGPDFPWQLLDDRAATLKATPANSFAYEAAHLAPAPQDSLRAVEVATWWGENLLDAARTKAEADGLPPPQAALLTRMRAAPDAAAAYIAGAGLPEAVRHYTAGAVAFRTGDPTEAAKRFDTALRLDPNGLRATWAAYMRARLHAMAGETDQAAAGFAQTRALAIHGAPDPFGLAVASYGEEARLYLGTDRPTGDVAALARAAALYAEQAARGSDSGVQSLRMLAEEMLGIGQDAAPANLPAAAQSPLLQRLLVAYVLARVEDDPPGQPNPLLGRLVDAIEAAGGEPPAADRLAALCYRSGRYELAAKLAARATGPLAAWVRAKLALQHGDLAAATAAYAEAAQAFPDTAPLDDANRRLVVGERGTLTLARGEYLEALTQLFPVANVYWGDVAYIAERVLTADELKRFVDEQVPAPPAPATERHYDDETAPNWLVSNPSTQLRDLLARRLVRLGRITEALPYFHRAEDTALADPDVRQHAAAYAGALEQATSLWWRVERARAWFEAAKLARWHGMEMMGTDGPPDYLSLSGWYGTGVGQERPGDAYVSAGEKDRFAASSASPELRFHYRFVAVEHASLAADLLPPRSQAFAAVLCQATAWMMSTTGKLDIEQGQPNPAEQRIHALYQRYVRQGPYVPWAAHFGQSCPEPDFNAAEHAARWQIVHDIRATIRPHNVPILLAGVGLTLIAALWLWRSRHIARR